MLNLYAHTQILPRRRIVLLARLAAGGLPVKAEHQEIHLLARDELIRRTGGNGFHVTFDGRQILDAYRKAGWIE